METQLTVFDSAEEVAHAAAQTFVECAREAIDVNGRFSVALSGGSTPRRVFQLLASNMYRSDVDWSRTHIFFGDERCVPANDPASNYRMAYEELISHLSIPDENVHPIKGEGDPVANARTYEEELRVYFANLDWPRFDLIFLGLGADGHTASIFPHTAAVEENRSWVVANWVEKLGSFRITLTAPAINQAVKIVFLVNGRDKAKALDAILHDPKDPQMYPAQLVQPDHGSVIWLVDKDAAAAFRT